MRESRCVDARSRMQKHLDALMGEIRGAPPATSAPSPATRKAKSKVPSSKKDEPALLWEIRVLP
eukprot:12819817-Alexandrium_andersonii.AAC.1